MQWHYISALCDLKRTPDTRSETVSQGLYGERLTIMESTGRWHRIRNLRDGYEGFVPVDAVAPCAAIPTHQVTVRSTLLFELPDIKSPVVTGLMYSSELVLVAERHERFSRTADGCYVWSAHCAPLHHVSQPDPVAAALDLFSGTPYLWGGRSPRGCDCSALVQLAAHAGGICLPRDSSDQEAALAWCVDLADGQRNDLVFWPGHVGLLIEPGVLWHATAHFLSVRRESLADVIDRAGEPGSVRRLPLVR